MLSINELLARIRESLNREGEWQTATIPINGTQSSAVDLGGYFSHLQVVIPTINSAQLELMVSDKAGGTYQDLGQNALTIAGTGAYSDTWNLGGWRFIKLKASASQSTAAREFSIRGINHPRVSLLDAIKNMPERFDFVLKPFGKGSLTTDGVQYSAEVGSIAQVYTAIETVTITQPSGYTLEEVEFSLTVAIKNSGATDAVNWKMQASDAGSSWEDLIAEQTRAASAAAYLDVSALGRFAPTGNFLGTSGTFQVRAVIKSAGATDTATGKMKSSSYVIVKYRRT